MLPKTIRQTSTEFPRLGKAQIERIPCNCVAQKHELINNCLNCGKVVCASEGEGPCLKCGNRVTKQETQYVNRDDKELFPSMNEEQLKQISLERSNARKHKNVLVNRDTVNGIVQNIYDEQTDYYELSENQWANEQDRKFAVERILLEKKKIDDQSSVNNVYFDHQTNQWIKVDYVYDQQKFKKEAQTFIKQSQTKQITEKIKKSNEVNSVDVRLKNNEKTATIYEQLKKQLGPAPIINKKQIAQKLKYRAQQDVIIQ